MSFSVPRGAAVALAALLPLSAILVPVAAVPSEARAAAMERTAQYQPPGSIADQGDEGPEDNVEPSAMVVRVGRLENQIRSLTGQIEQLQNQNKRLADDLRKMQGDVDFRFQDLQRGSAPAQPRPIQPQRRGDASPATPDAPGPAVAIVTPADIATDPATSTPGRRTGRSTGDAFDPDAQPTAPGSPRPLGSTPPSQPLASRPTVASAEPRGPLDLMQRQRNLAGTPNAIDEPPDALPPVIAAPPAARPATSPTTSVASLVPGGTREEFDADLGLYKQGQFDGAATGLRSFVDKYPKDKLVPEAVYLTGESYSKLGRHREAAEQFLKVSTEYGKSGRAPDALLRLGMSLGALGAKDQACATFEEVNKRYPAASGDVKAGVDRELRRSRCRTDG